LDGKEIPMLQKGFYRIDLQASQRRADPCAFCRLLTHMAQRLTPLSSPPRQIAAWIIATFR
jgi:hypothetical protein